MDLILHQNKLTMSFIVKFKYKNQEILKLHVMLYIVLFLYGQGDYWA